jgi:hypothetical protein
MVYVKSVRGDSLLEVEAKMNKFLKKYNGELLQFQVLKPNHSEKYEAIFSYRYEEA